MTTCAPIVLFIYSRPEHTARILASLAANVLAAESDLIIYADGPKEPEHAAAVQAARAVARGAQGFKSVRILEREQNIGLAASIMTGVSEVCATAGRAIIVEDDLVVAPDFLRFLNAGLDRYAGDERVLQVSGYAYPLPRLEMPLPYFLPMISCWGWATWGRAWGHFDPQMKALAALDADSDARKRFNIDGTYDYYGMACAQRSGQVDSWGVRWQLSLFAKDGLVLYPQRSLVYNTGTDASGTHGAGHSAFQDRTAAGASLAVSEWPSVELNREMFEHVKKLLRNNRPSLWYRAKEWMGR